MKKQKDETVITDRFCLIVQHDSAMYECKVDELLDENETYYHVDVLSPFGKESHDHIRQNVYHIEMRLDCATQNYVINTFHKKLPVELVQIEQKLSDALCARH